MPFDLSSVQRGYGEVPVDFNGHVITVQYRADLDSRAMLAMQRLMVGVPTVMGGDERFPDLDGVINELLRLLVGWDITRDGEPIQPTRDEILRLPPVLPLLILQRIVGDVNDPNRRKPSLDGSSVRASSQPIASQIITDSSVTPDGPVSSPGLSLVSRTTPDNGPVGATG